MENNRRSFFKGLAAFVSGVAAAKVSSYIPKKEEDVLVSGALTIHHEGEDYHPLVVKKSKEDKILFAPNNGRLGFGTSPEGVITIKEFPKPTIRKANI